MSEYIVCVDDLEESYYRYTNIKPETVFGHRLSGEIVRCRDCVHGIKADLSGNWYECMKPDGNGDYARWDVEPDGFCAWGERRINDN